jgi:hypothetical protein
MDGTFHTEDIFLNNDVYGQGDAISALRQRWRLYRDLCYYDEGGNRVWILPRPMAMGNSWYKVAVEAMERTDWKMVKSLSDPRY